MDRGFGPKENAMQDVSREPTADEQAGMNWWNALPERLRSYWLQEAGSTTASVADAWGKFKSARAMTDNSVYSQQPIRAYSGLEFVGFEFSILVLPGDDGWLGVRVTAEPPATGFKQGATLGSESTSRLRFGVNAQIGSTTLEWFAQDEHVPLYWEGFKLVLQPHQCEQLRAWLPRLGRTAVLAQSLATAVKRSIGDDVPTLHYLGGFVSDLAARVVLDGQDAGEAISAQLANHWAAQEKGLQPALQSPGVAALLQTALFTEKQRSAS